MNTWGALSGMITGAVTVVLWKEFGLGDVLYEIIPGFAVSVLMIYVVSLITAAPSSKVVEQFDEVKRLSS